MTNIGGFFASLGIKVDTNSFDKSKNALDNVSNGFSRMLGVARNATAIVQDLTLSMGEMGSAEVRIANYLGISTHALADWRNTAKLASIDSNALVNDISNLETKLSRINQGVVPNDMVKALGLLGVNQDIISFSNMGMAERVQVVFDAAAANGNQTNAADLIGQILGSNFKDLYLSGIVQTEGFAAVFEKAQKLNYTDEATMKQAELFNVQKDAFTTAIDNMSKFLSGELAKDLTPALTSINNWLASNGTVIKNTLSVLAEKISGLLTTTGVFLTDFSSEISKISEKITLLIPEKTLKRLQDIGSTIIQSPADFAIGIAKVFGSIVDLAGAKTPEEAKEKGNVVVTSLLNLGIAGFSPRSITDIQDGIISPGGRITKVAPDDWVFAARNLSDMAGAFIPHSFNSQAAKNDIVINQTINVTGNNDTHTIRQQARLGLADALQQANRYAQMMPQLN